MVLEHAVDRSAETPDDRTLLRQRLAAARDEVARLRELDRWKDAFLAAAAHDLRAPVAVICGAADVLASEPADVGTVRDLAQRIGAEGRRLGRLLEDLLDLDRFTRGLVAAERAPTDVRDVIERAIASIDTGQHPVDIDVPAVVADLDGRRVSQIVTNLVSNAVAHTPPPAAIHVRVGTGTDAVTLIVEDEGPGIPDDVRDRVFTPFFSAGGGAAHGTGIGLSLVELFAELHGGTVSVAERPGGGARFVVVLPCDDIEAAGE